MTASRGNDRSDPARAGTELWETGYRSLMDGWRQAQEFWTGAARGQGGATNAWMGQANRAMSGVTGLSEESMTLLRELQEATLAVAQAWMRLPLTLVGASPPGDLQDAITKLTETQGRAYQLWLESLNRFGGAATQAAEAATPRSESERKR